MVQNTNFHRGSAAFLQAPTFNHSDSSLNRLDMSSAKKRKTLQSSSFQTVRLFQGLGVRYTKYCVCLLTVDEQTHYADLWCGSPEPQRQTVIVDTGSSTTAFPCSHCKNCGKDYHVDEPFLQELSTSFRKEICQDCSLGTCQGNECRFGVSYLEGSSWSAVESVDNCYLGGFHNQAVPSTFQWFKNGRDPHSAKDFALNLSFGCQTDVSGDFTHQLADGIMGMNNGPTAVFEQMFAQETIPSRAFSLCFQRSEVTRRSGTESGVMTLGGSDTKLHRRPMAFTPLEPGGFYSVQLRKVYLVKGDSMSEVVQINVPSTLKESGRKHVIIDSGTTDSYFTREMQADFYKAWLSVVGLPFSNDPFAMSVEEVIGLPSIVLQFEGIDGNHKIFGQEGAPLAGSLDPDYPYDLVVTIPPSHFVEYHPDQAGYVAGVYWDEPEGIVLGANTMMGHDILFDVENARVGWAESSCNYTEIAELDTSTSTKLYSSPSLRFRPPSNSLTTQKKALQNDHIIFILAFLLVMTTLLLGSLILLVRQLFRKNSALPRRSSSLPLGRELKRSVSRSTQRSISDITVKRQMRRNESRSILQAVEEAGENPQNIRSAPPRHIPSRMFSKRSGLLRSRSQQVDRDSTVSLL